MARSTGIAFALAVLVLAAPALADGSPQNSLGANGLGSLTGIGSTQDLNRPSSGRVTGIAVDPSDPSAPRPFNGVVNRISQGDDSKTSDPTGNTIYVGSANGGVWKTTNGGNAANSPDVGFLRSTDSGKTWSAPAGGSHNTGALRNVSNSNTGSPPPTGPMALRAKTN